MFRVSQHPSSGVLKTVAAASGTGHNIGPSTSFQRGQLWPMVPTMETTRSRSPHPTPNTLKEHSTHLV